MKLGLLLAPFLIASFCSSCIVSLAEDFGADVVGSGVARSELRSSDDFQRIEVRGSFDVVAEVGASTSLEVTADDNLLPYIITRVENGTLILEMKDGSYSSHVPQVARITSPRLDGFAVEGSGDARLSKLTGPSFSIAISGSGDVAASGAVDALSIDISGSGDVAARELGAKRVRISIAGSGDVSVDATEDLDVSIAGSGDVNYVGHPRVKQSVSGSGDVTGG
ncbi:MAG: DUF2807 domain-containing protein [Planctomycetes bacterium]|nr:DUF2807 domain-containing protein [Planctomycetota bacterium]